MRKFGLRRALSTKPVPRQTDPEFMQEDVDEHGHFIQSTAHRQPARKNSLLGRVFRKKSKQPDDLHTIHSEDIVPVHPGPTHHPPPMHDYEAQHSFAGAASHLMDEPPVVVDPSRRDYSVRDGRSHRDGHSARDGHSIQDGHSIHAHSVRDGRSAHNGTVYRDDISRGGYATDYASTAGGRHHDYVSNAGGHQRVYEHDYGQDDGYPEHVTVMTGSPRHSHVTSPHSYHHVPVSVPGTVINDRHARSSSSSRSSRSGRRPVHHTQPGELAVNLQPGEKQEFVIGPNTQLIVPDDVELEISDGKGGWMPYHESLLRRPPREEVYVISGGSNFIVEDEMGNVLHRSQPSTYSAAPMSVAGSTAGRSTRSRRDNGMAYVDG